MPKHLNVEHSLHDLTEHAVQTATFTQTDDIVLYAVADKSAAQFVGVISDGTDYTKIIAEIGSDATNIGFDSSMFAIKGDLLDVDLSVHISSGNAVLRITGEISQGYTLKYYIVSNNLI